MPVWCLEFYGRLLYVGVQLPPGQDFIVIFNFAFIKKNTFAACISHLHITLTTSPVSTSYMTSWTLSGDI